MVQEEHDLIIVAEDEAGTRLDKLLAERFKENHSRSYFQYLIDQHLVLLNGEPVKKRIKPLCGDEIEVQFAATPEISLSPEQIPLEVIFEDEHLLAVNKPAGLVIHPAPGNWSGTFVNALLYHCRQLESVENSLRPGIVHRLDKDTSGILLAAKTLESQQKLIALFASRGIYKEYCAVCIGRPIEGEIRAPIGRHPTQRKQMAVVPEGKEAVSNVKWLGGNDRLSFLQVVISTGRTHQIRVHLKHCGTPVLGDDLYGNPSINHSNKVDRQLLHARLLRLIHPITGEFLELCAPIPSDILHFVQKMSIEVV